MHPSHSAQAARISKAALLGSTTKGKTCNCKNSRCLKLYCECFASGSVCSPNCNCIDCCNHAGNAAERQLAVEATLERNPHAFQPKIISSNIQSSHMKV